MIIFFGQPGAGKTTQGQMLAASQNWCWLAAGQLLRDCRDPEVVKIAKRGDLVPSDIVIRLVGDELARHSECKNIVIDGFARNIDQADWLIHQAATYNRSVELVFVIDIPIGELIERLKVRGRADDTPEVVENRLNVYSQETYPVLEYFEQQGVKVVHIDGTGTVQQVNDRIMKVLLECKVI